jgi:hypothetical protein
MAGSSWNAKAARRARQGGAAIFKPRNGAFLEWGFALQLLPNSSSSDAVNCFQEAGLLLVFPAPCHRRLPLLQAFCSSLSASRRPVCSWLASHRAEVTLPPDRRSRLRYSRFSKWICPPFRQNHGLHITTFYFQRKTIAQGGHYAVDHLKHLRQSKATSSFASIRLRLIHIPSRIIQITACIVLVLLTVIQCSCLKPRSQIQPRWTNARLVSLVRDTFSPWILVITLRFELTCPRSFRWQLLC